MDTSSIESGLSTAESGVVGLMKYIVDSIAIPIIDTFLVGLLIFLIASSVQKHRQGEDYSQKIFLIIGVVIIIAVVSTFPTWGWKLIGVAS